MKKHAKTMNELNKLSSSTTFVAQSVMCYNIWRLSDSLCMFTAKHEMTSMGNLEVLQNKGWALLLSFEDCFISSTFNHRQWALARC